MSTTANYGVTLGTFYKFVSRAKITSALLRLKQTFWGTYNMQTDFNVIWQTFTGMEVFVNTHTYDRQWKCFCWWQCVVWVFLMERKLSACPYHLQSQLRDSVSHASVLLWREHISFSSNGWNESQPCRWNGLVKLHWKTKDVCVLDLAVWESEAQSK